MSYTKDVTIWCEYCTQWTMGDSGEYAVSAVRKNIRSQGWRYVNGEDICPECLKSQENS